MSKANNLLGAAAQQKAIGHGNELLVMFALAKFGWLTSHQVGQWIWNDDVHGDNEHSRKILARLHKQRCVNFEVMPRSPGKQMKAWFLKPRGMTMLKDFCEFDDVRVRSTRRKITDERYQYHRLLTNQSLIDLSNNNINLGFNTNGDVYCEHEVRANRKNINSQFGCVPDGFLLSNSRLMLVEVENSCRGPARHGSKLQGYGNKLEAWLPSFTDRRKREGAFDGHVDFLNESYSDACELFCCSNEKIFRNIHRKINALLDDADDGYNVFYYVVMQKPLWVDPFRSENITIFDHDDPEALGLIAAGEKYQRKYKKKSK